MTGNKPEPFPENEVVTEARCQVHRDCSVAFRYKDTRRVGRRRPYVGHIRRLAANNWLATTPGGARGRSFPTRREAAAQLARWGEWA